MNKPLIYTGKCMLMLCAAYCTLGIIISAFDFTAGMAGLFFILLISSAAVTALCAAYRSRGILIAAAPALILFLWNYARIAEGFKQTVNAITLRYNEWLPVPVLFSEENEALQALGQVLHRAGEDAAMQAAGRVQDETPVFFAALGIAIVLALAPAICLRRSTLFTVLPTLPFVLLTFILKNITYSIHIFEHTYLTVTMQV